jgi:hypothetical protein
MKPWEETWMAAEDYDSVHIEGDNEDRLDMRAGRPDSMARCRLAAAAPEMARLLLDEMESRTCNWCGQKVDRTEPTGDGGFRSRPEVHARSCELVGVLRKAGVLP